MILIHYKSALSQRPSRDHVASHWHTLVRDDQLNVSKSTYLHVLHVLLTRRYMHWETIMIPGNEENAVALNVFFVRSGDGGSVRDSLRKWMLWGRCWEEITSWIIPSISGLNNPIILPRGNNNNSVSFFSVCKLFVNCNSFVCRLMVCYRAGFWWQCHLTASDGVVIQPDSAI